MKKLALFSIAMTLVACSNTTNKQPEQLSTVQTIDTSVAAYAGDCANVQGSLPVLNALDRDQWLSLIHI